MEITENKSGQKSLRFPVFVRFRDDKNTTNIMWSHQMTRDELLHQSYIKYYLKEKVS